MLWIGYASIANPKRLKKHSFKGSSMCNTVSAAGAPSRDPTRSYHLAEGLEDSTEAL